MVLRMSEAAMDEIARFYIIRDTDNSSSPKVAPFIERNPALIDVLLDARDTLQRIFPGSSYTLTAYPESRWAWRSLRYTMRTAARCTKPR